MKTRTYTEIARKTGLSVSHVSRVVRGVRSPSLRSLSLIAGAMGVPMSVLIKRMGAGQCGGR